ncbi:MAG: GLPGLI family protein [Muribaculaceae bacterium]|nr:GLPGLI family protein [Muribaculaceae bacterium]
MNWKAIIVTGMTFFLALSTFAKKKEYPRAEIKVGYTYHETFVRGSNGIIKRDLPFVLLANKEQSKFYSPATERKDSLESTPKGRAVSDQLFREAVKRYTETKDESVMEGVVYKTFLYIFRSLPKNEMTVYDKVGMLEQGCYTEPLGEIEWEIGDSTKNVLGYECVMAKTNYHGRDWTAWFAPDIPISEGPWKLTGLPGLILEATESTGQHGFIATGLESTNQEIYPIYPYRQYEKMTRIDMLKQKRNYKDHSSSINSAATGIDFGKDYIITEEESKIDFLETDYHQ